MLQSTKPFKKRNMKINKFLIVLISAFFTGFLALHATNSSPIKDKVQFTFIQKGDQYDFHGVFTVAADSQAVWDVLTDYNHFSEFISNMHCHIRQREGNDLLVDETVGGGFLFIRQEVKGLLKVHEEPLTTFSLEEVSQKSFQLYQGVWKILLDPSGKSAKVSYDLQAQRNRFTPHFVTADLFRQSSEDLMVEMKREIERRKAKK